MTSALKAPVVPAPTAPSGRADSHIDATVPVPRPHLTAVPDCEPPFDDQRSAVGRLQRLRAATQARLAAAPADSSGAAVADPADGAAVTDRKSVV